MRSRSHAVNLILTARQMQEADRRTIEELGVPASRLMQQAGEAVAEVVRQGVRSGRFRPPVLVVCGLGNNGGDGFAAARYLYGQGVEVRIAMLGRMDRLTGSAAEHAAQASAAGVVVDEIDDTASLNLLDVQLEGCGCVVDALFGTGLTRPVEGVMAGAIGRINRSGCFVLAVDIPSGIHSDSGEVMGCAVRAGQTLPVAATKWGHWLLAGPDHTGLLLPVADIGIPESVIADVQRELSEGAGLARLIDHHDVVRAFPRRRRDAHKKKFGDLWIFAGSRGLTGAPRLAALGAQAIRTGLVSIACPEDVYPIVAASSLEVMVHSEKQAVWQGRASALVVGPGWGARQVRDVVDLVLCDLPLVLDADALNMLSREVKEQELLLRRKAPTVLTPHPGEAARLLEISTVDVQQDRVGTALALAEKLRAWVVLKGAETLVVSPDGALWLSPFGSVNLAVAGTGDVLAGIIGGLLAQGIETGVALRAAVALHGLAGEAKGWHRAGQLEGIVAAEVERLCR